MDVFRIEVDGNPALIAGSRARDAIRRELNRLEFQFSERCEATSVRIVRQDAFNDHGWWVPCSPERCSHGVFNRVDCTSGTIECEGRSDAMYPEYEPYKEVMDRGARSFCDRFWGRR